ncbi:MAG: carboxylesterase/lipase family protein [Gammaproteobacteria bacterium]
MRPIIETNSGPVEGIEEEYQGTKGFSFKGIPYAADTSGKNRWRAPQDPDSWSDPLDASSFGPQCPQFRMGEGGFRGLIAGAYGIETPIEEPPKESEDCLRLNIYSPDLSPNEKAPVMFWIHGGALRYGSSDQYLPDGIIEKGNVLVTINYRLGELGFFAHPSINESDQQQKTNFGLLDQIKALEWVNKNIENFGGDPSNITIFGESAGGFSVAALLVSPLSEGLFHQAIVQSGGFARMALHSAETSEAGFSAMDIGARFGELCEVPTGPDQLRLMRELPVEKIIDVGKIGFSSSFFVDGNSILSPVMNSFEDGLNHKVPTIIGTNADEGTALYWGSPLADVPPPINSVEKYKMIIADKFKENSEKIMSIYPASDKEEMVKSSKNLLGDSLFGAPSYFAAKAMAKRGEDIYFYHFNQKPSGKAGELLGAFHAYEIGYVFGVGGLGPIENQDLSNTMLSYWTNFAVKGDPNSDELPKWETMKSDRDSWHVLGQKVGEEAIDRMEIYNLLDKV